MTPAPVSNRSFAHFGSSNLTPPTTRTPIAVSVLNASHTSFLTDNWWLGFETSREGPLMAG